MNFVKFIKAGRYEVHLFIEATENNEHLIKFQLSRYEARMYNFNKCLKNQSYNWEKHSEGVHSIQLGYDAKLGR